MSVDDKPILATSDNLIIASLFGCITFGALLQTTTDVGLTYVYLGLSCLFCLACPYLMVRSYFELSEIMSNSSRSRRSTKGKYQRRVLLASRKFTLSACIGLLFPIFPVLYFLRVSHIISDAQGYTATAAASAFVKVLFASLCMDAHLEVSHPAVALIDAEKFSRYMH